MLAQAVSRMLNRMRLTLLKLYARHEVALLRTLYRLLHGRAVMNRMVKELLYWTLVAPTARWGISGEPLAPEDLEEFLGSMPRGRYAVGPCRCRLAHGACGHPLETDIVIKEGFGIWRDLFPAEYREITVAETLELCRSLHDGGLAQVAFRHVDVGTNENYFVICNCCSDGCLPILSLRFYGAERYPFRKGRRAATVEKESCRGCGTCVEVCPFGTRSLVAGKAAFAECFGCGLCASHCPEGAAGTVLRGG